MEDKNISKNEKKPILLQSSTSKSSKCNYSKILALLSLLLMAVLVCIYNTFQNKSIDNDEFSKAALKRRIDDTTTDLGADNYCSVTSDNDKFDCFPRGKADQRSCEERRCCWSPNSPNSRVPWCYYPSNYSNYKVINVTKTRNEIQAYFNLTMNSNYKDDIRMLCMDISLQTAKRLRIKVIDVK